jgi:hypothetical protein
MAIEIVFETHATVLPGQLAGMPSIGTWVFAAGCHHAAMVNYAVRLDPAPNGHVLPPLLVELGAWLVQRTHGSVGWFDALTVEPIPTQWDPGNAERLNRAGFAFLYLPDGSLLALLHRSPTAPPAVVLLGSEGETGTIANSLEELLLLWSTADTGIDDLDDGDVSGREKLVAWLAARRVIAPAGTGFDFVAWLDGRVDAVAPPDPHRYGRGPTPAASALAPKLRELAALVGRRANDPDVLRYITQTLSKKAPATTSAMKDRTHVEAPRLGVEMLFSHVILNDKYPPAKTARSFVPYFAHVWVRPTFGEAVPGIDWNGDEDAVTATLGQPDGRRPRFATVDDETIPFWTRTLDTATDVILRVEVVGRPQVTLAVDAARKLDHSPGPATHVFLAWAATRDLLNDARFAAHADLLEAVRQRAALGSQLAAAALPRGLWDVHLRDEPKLRITAYRYFHNMNGLWITKDLREVFGSRTGTHGHEEPILDIDSWPAVDQAARVFDQRFAT